MKFAAVQMTSGLDVAANVATARRLLREAAAQGARLAVLPENFALMAQTRARQARDRRNRWRRSGAEPAVGVRARAGHHAGRRAPFPSACRARSAWPRPAWCTGPTASRIGRYDKIHLFDVNVPDAAESHRESAGMVPGRGIGVFDTPAGRIGVAVCYDLRFPELFRRMVDMGAQAFVVSAAFTVPTGEAHWHLLLRARAVENLCALVASAQVGNHQNGRQTYGHSAVIDCWGRVLAELARWRGRGGGRRGFRAPGARADRIPGT